MKYIQVVIMTVIMFVHFVQPALSRQIDLIWEPSPSPAVIGYKVYYQQGSPLLPLTGTEADQGHSPVDVGNSLVATLSGLDDSAVYYFSVTAYDSNYNESTFSNIVSTAWMPLLRNPQRESLVIPWNVTFQWDAGPADHHLIYTLYYGTNKNQVMNAGLTPGSFGSFPGRSSPLPSHQGLLTVSALLLILLLALTPNRILTVPYLKRTAFAGLVIFALAACGEGGGSGWSGEGQSFSSTALTSVNTGSSTSYQASGLESGATYYWKVDAHSTTEPGTVFYSEVRSFTTQ